MLLAYSSAQELRAHSLTFLREGRRQVDGTDRREGELFLTIQFCPLMRPIPYLERGRFGFERNSSLAVKGRRLCSRISCFPENLTLFLVCITLRTIKS